MACEVDVERILTPIMQSVDGYAVVVVQEKAEAGGPGKFLGCILRAPGCADDDRPMLLLTEAVREYKKKTGSLIAG